MAYLQHINGGDGFWKVLITYVKRSLNPLSDSVNFSIGPENVDGIAYTDLQFTYLKQKKLLLKF